VQPLSGEYGGRRSALEKIPFFSGYGVETGLLIDIYDEYGIQGIAQVDLLERIHHNQALEALSKMSFAIIQAVLHKQEKRFGKAAVEEVNKSMKLIRYNANEGYSLDVEEIAERAYRIDRLLQQMKQAKIFDGVSAVVFGDFVNCQEADGKDYVQPTLENFFRDMKIPAFKGMQAGHGEIQRPVFFNTQTVLTCGSTAQMLNYGPK